MGWDKLVELAKARNSSVGTLIRSAVIDKISEHQLKEHSHQAIKTIREIRPKLKGTIDYKELIGYGRN